MKFTILIILISAFLISSCGQDEDKNNKFLGTYVRETLRNDLKYQDGYPSITESIITGVDLNSDGTYTLYEYFLNRASYANIRPNIALYFKSSGTYISDGSKYTFTPQDNSCKIYPPELSGKITINITGNPNGEVTMRYPNGTSLALSNLKIIEDGEYIRSELFEKASPMSIPTECDDYLNLQIKIFE